MSVSNYSELRTVYKPPAPRATQKVLDHLDVHCRNFIALSPLCVLSSANADGQADASPRGDPPGFVQVLDDKTLLLPDRPGNNQVDSLQNIVQNSGVGLLFFVPGMNETLRVKGKAEIVTDAEVLEPMTEKRRAPVTGRRLPGAGYRAAGYRGGGVPALRPGPDPFADLGPGGADRPFGLSHVRASAGGPDQGSER